jgi:hypothetical protein
MILVHQLSPRQRTCQQHPHHLRLMAAQLHVRFCRRGHLRALNLMYYWELRQGYTGWVHTQESYTGCCPLANSTQLLSCQGLGTSSHC